VDLSTGRFFLSYTEVAMPEHSQAPARTEPSSNPALPAFVEQRYEAYSTESHDVWRLLYERRMATLRDTVFLDGIERIGLAPDRVPDLADVNRRLAARTGWAAVGVGGFIPAPEFFRSLSHRRFPTTLSVRPRAQLDYLPEPDIFHDVFGHVPLHSHPVFADFLQQFGALAASADSEAKITEMARLFWFTVEFGLIRESGEVKIYGSGLISSQGDAANALSDRCDRRRFDLDAVVSQPFEIDRLQDVLFVLDSFDQLFEGVERLRQRQLVSGP
jgi:phenylalanine-4-hydroxylase